MQELADTFDRFSFEGLDPHEMAYYAGQRDMLKYMKRLRDDYYSEED
jgi:hypothetical protein